VEHSVPQTFTDVACTVCGCVCDDLRLTFDGQRLTRAERACALAQPWFEAIANSPARETTLVNGKPASLPIAIEQAATILRSSRAPLLWGLARSSTQGVRAAVQLAELTGATIDSATSLRNAASVIAFQQVGQSTCSLGEVRNRADLVIFWGANPVVNQPRHLERYSVEAKGMFIPRGRSDRHVVYIGAEDNETSRLADSILKCRHDSHLELIRAMQQVLNGAELPASLDVGPTHAQLLQLLQQMKECRYGALFYGPELAKQGAETVAALFSLVTALNQRTRFTVSGLGSPGPEATLTWLTGYPFAIDFSQKYPRYSPDQFTATARLERGEVDTCVLVGSECIEELSAKGRAALEQLPVIVLDEPHVSPRIDAAVQFTTAIYGIHATGTTYRMDGAPIPLRKLIDSDYPNDAQVLSKIAAHLGRRSSY
jgi:formylmethanofuran dehydrogenase subunit B